MAHHVWVGLRLQYMEAKSTMLFSFLSTVLLNDKFVLMTCHQGEYVKHNRSIGMIDR